MTGLIPFMSARLDEEEAAAKAVDDNSAPWDGQWQPRERHALETYNGWVLAVSVPAGSDFQPGVVEHIARHDPARALREVEAKRARIAVLHEAVSEMDRQLADDDAKKIDQGVAIGRYQMALVAVKHDAAIYSDHPDYSEKMRP